MPEGEDTQFLVQLRRELHRHPELRFHEHRTARVIAEVLADAGYDLITGVGGTGVLATLRGSLPGPHVVYRADMDALPIPDGKTVPYSSEEAGVVHACGHDVHMTVAVGVARRMVGQIARGVTSFLFQPAEETPFGAPSGSKAVISSGVFKRMPPDFILGLHCWPSLRAGSIGIDTKIAMAAKDAYKISVGGTAAHAAELHQGKDAIHALALMVTLLYQILPRETRPGSRAIVHVGTIEGGRSQSVVADRAEATGTIRTVDLDTRTRLKEAFATVLEGVAESMRIRVGFEWADEVPTVVNHPALVARARTIAQHILLPDQVVIIDEPPMTSDDFAFYGELAPTLYLKLGVAGEAACPPLHNPLFDIDESAIATGVDVMSELVLNLLAEPVDAGPSPDDKELMSAVESVGSCRG